MPKMIFVNLPVADVARATRFHEALGAQQNPQFSDASASMMVYSDTIAVMLLSRERFADFTDKQIIDPKTQVQTLICLSADSRGEVDDLVDRAGAAGGRMDPGPKQDHGFMYGRSFEDPDGHVFELVWMDVAAAPRALTEVAGAASN